MSTSSSPVSTPSSQPDAMEVTGSGSDQQRPNERDNQLTGEPMSSSPLSVLKDPHQLPADLLRLTDCLTRSEDQDEQDQRIMDAVRAGTRTVNPTRRFVQFAQILADQIVYHEGISVKHDDEVDVRIGKDPISDVVASIFPQSKRCTLEDCSLLGEDRDTRTLKPTPKSFPKKQDSFKLGQDNEVKQLPSIFHQAAPFIRAKRGEEVSLDLSPTALSFWNELGLRPIKGSKDVTAFCLCPDSPALRRGADRFMETLGQTYLSMRLGSHSAGDSSLEIYPSGFVTCPNPEDTGKDHIFQEFGRMSDKPITAG